MTIGGGYGWGHALMQAEGQVGVDLIKSSWSKPVREREIMCYASIPLEPMNWTDGLQHAFSSLLFPPIFLSLFAAWISNREKNLFMK